MFSAAAKTCGVSGQSWSGWGRWFQVEVQAPAQHPVAAVQKRLGPQGEDLVGTGAPKLGKSSELLMSGACGRKNTMLSRGKTLAWLLVRIMADDCKRWMKLWIALASFANI